MLKAICNLQLRVRQLMGAEVDTFIGKSDNPIIKAAEAEGRHFAAAVGAYHKAKETNPDAPPPGPPADAVFCGILEHVINEDIGAINKETIKQILADIDTDGPSTFNLDIHMCKLERCANPQSTKVLIAMNTYKDRKTVISALTNAGFQHLRGPAPPGYLEEDLSEWAAAIEETIA